MDGVAGAAPGDSVADAVGTGDRAVPLVVVRPDALEPVVEVVGLSVVVVQPATRTADTSIGAPQRHCCRRSVMPAPLVPTSQSAGTGGCTDQAAAGAVVGVAARAFASWKTSAAEATTFSDLGLDDRVSTQACLGHGDGGVPQRITHGGVLQCVHGEQAAGSDDGDPDQCFQHAVLLCPGRSPRPTAVVGLRPAKQRPAVLSLVGGTVPGRTRVGCGLNPGGAQGSNGRRYPRGDSPRTAPLRSHSQEGVGRAAMTTVQRRNTSQRAAISDLLSGTDEFVSAQDLHAILRASGSTVGLATVYRALQDMATAGAVDAVRNENGEVLYRRCVVPSHHHHLVCRTCGRTEEIDAPGGRGVGAGGRRPVRLHRRRPRRGALRRVRGLQQRPPRALTDRLARRNGVVSPCGACAVRSLRDQPMWTAAPAGRSDFLALITTSAITMATANRPAAQRKATLYPWTAAC